MGARAVSGLINILRDKSHADVVRYTAARALGEIGSPRAVAPLAEAAGTGEYRVAGAAGWALGKSGEKGFEALLRLLESTDPDVRKAAVRGLVACDMPAASDALRDVIAGAADEMLVDLAFIGLEYRKDTAALESLLVGGDEAKRRRAFVRIGRLGDRRALDVCMELAMQPAADDRHLAVDALGKIGDPAAVPLLVDLLSESIDAVGKAPEPPPDVSGPPFPWAASGVASALAAIGGDTAVDALLHETKRAADLEVPGLLDGMLWALERTGRPEARALVDELLPESSSYIKDPAVLEIVKSNGLKSFDTNWRAYLFREWAEEHASLFSLALERCGTVEMARGYLECYPWPHIRNIVREWAERHGRTDEFKDLLEE